jgi:iron complex outermembrane receptor protein
MTFRQVLMSSIAGSAVILTGSAATAADPTSAAASSSAGATVTEVIVTAQKREESLTKVPVAVTAFTPTQRDVIGLVTAQQQLDVTPGVVFTTGSPYSLRVSIRGIGRTNDQLGTDNGVAYYLDGIYNPDPTIAGDSTLRVERTEILRGPQGTLYGRNSVGGDINVISRRPSHDFEAEVRGTFNSYGGAKGEVRVAGPVSDHVRMSIDSIVGEQAEGFYRNICGNGPISPPGNCHPFTEGGNYTSGDVDYQISYDVNSMYDGWFRAYWSQSVTHPKTFATVTPYPISNSVGAGSDFATYGGINNSPASPSYLNPNSNPSIYDPRAFTADTENYQKLSPYIFLVTEQNIHLNFADVKYTGGYLHYNTMGYVEGDGTARASYTYDHVTCVNPAALGMNTATMVTALQTGAVPAFGGFGLGVLASAFAKPCSAASQFGQETLYPASVFNTNDNATSMQHEIDFTSKGDGPFKWLAGLYYFWSNDIGNNNYNSWLNNPHILNLFNAASPANPIPNPGQAQFLSSTGLQVWSDAVFAQFDWDVTKTIHFTGGIRYTYDSKKAHEAIFGGLDFPFAIFNDGSYAANGGGPVYLPTLNSVAQSYGTLLESGGPRTLTGHWSAPTGTASLQWTPNNDTNVYVRYSRGYKSGGFNLGSLSPLPYVGPETLDDYEGGWKQIYNGKLQSNLAIFFYEYHDMQAQDYTAFGTTTLPALINVKEAQSYGVEEELTWNVTDAFNVFFNYSYLHGTITQADPEVSLIDPTAILPGARPCGPPLANGNQPQCLTGNKIPNSPENKVVLGGVYTFHFEGAGNLSLSLNGRYHDGYYYNPYNGPNAFIPESAIADFTGKWDPTPHITVIGSVTNIFNKNAMTGQVTLPTSFSVLRYFEPPRVASLELRYRW